MLCISVYYVSQNMYQNIHRGSPHSITHRLLQFGICASKYPLLDQSSEKQALEHLHYLIQIAILRRMGLLRLRQFAGAFVMAGCMSFLIIAAGVIVSAILPFSGSVALAITRCRYHHRLLLRGRKATAARAVADHLDSLALPTRSFVRG